MSKHVAISPVEAADRLAIRELVEAHANCAERRDARPCAFVMLTTSFNDQPGRRPLDGGRAPDFDRQGRLSMRESLVGLVRSIGCEVRYFASAEDFLASGELERFTSLLALHVCDRERLKQF